MSAVARGFLAAHRWLRRACFGPVLVLITLDCIALAILQAFKALPEPFFSLGELVHAMLFLGPMNFFVLLAIKAVAWWLS